jgi:hypothetical protein
MMKNRVISHVHEQAKIYKNHYKPSLNPLRFVRALLGILISGQPSVAHRYNHYRK